MDCADTADGFDATTYGQSFADVYDTWYPADEETTSAVSYLSGLGGTAVTVLELGIGTGRLALPLAIAGHPVSGVDSSPEMLDLLAVKAAAAGVKIRSRCGDLGNADSWPSGPFGLVVAAFNFVFNLADAAKKQRLFELAADRLDVGGSLIVEAFVPVEREHEPPFERHLELKDVSAESVILIASSADHRSGVITGQHIELRNGEPVRLRPWRVHVASPDQLDVWAATAGLTLLERHADWRRNPFDEHAVRHVSRYVSEAPSRMPPEPAT